MRADTDWEEVEKPQMAPIFPIRLAPGDRAFTALRIPAGRRAGLQTLHIIPGRRPSVRNKANSDGQGTKREVSVNEQSQLAGGSDEG